jgi:hypothetical protein
VLSIFGRVMPWHGLRAMIPPVTASFRIRPSSALTTLQHHTHLQQVAVYM